MFEKFSAVPWLNEAEREGYRKAWGQPGRLNAMLNWYRSSPIIVPREGEPVPDAPLASGTPEQFGIHVPHLLIWGEADQALRPVCIDGLDAFAQDLEIVRLQQADHWLLHEYPDEIAGYISRFVESHSDDF
jgi:pimeloyl-ACP methyl ester carboxylesterase